MFKNLETYLVDQAAAQRALADQNADLVKELGDFRREAGLQLKSLDLLIKKLLDNGAEPPVPEQPVVVPPTEPPSNGLTRAPILRITGDSEPTEHTGIVDNINNDALPDKYPHAWFEEGTGKSLQVQLHEKIRLDHITLKMYNPVTEPRVYSVRIGDVIFRNTAAAPEIYTCRLPEITADSFTLVFDGNNRVNNDWNGCFRVLVDTSTALTVKPEPESEPEPPNSDFDQWPVDARTADFRTTYTDLAGYHLMKEGRDFVKHFRYVFGYEGRSASVTNQTEFNTARDNGDVGVIRFISPKPVVLIDRKRSHNSVQLLVCETLSHVRTWGNLAIDCRSVTAPQAGGCNVIAHGSNVLYSKHVDAQISHTWADLSIQPPSPNLIRNVITQGGSRKGNFSAGAEKVSVGVAAWTSNWEQYWDDDVENRDFPINTDNCGMQGMEDVDPGADTHQNLQMTDWQDPKKKNHPHGVITNLNPFVIGCLMAVLKAKWDPALGEGEQGVDEKAALMMLIRDCIMSGFMVNKIGANNAWGGGVFSSHFNVDKTKTQRCIGANQHRHIEIGSGAENLIEECLFADTQTAFDYVTKKGHNAGGQHDIVGYREERYAWAKLGHETAVQARNNVFDHKPRYSMGKGVPFENDGELIVDPRFNVYKDFGPIGNVLIGTKDPRAKDSVWYAGS